MPFTKGRKKTGGRVKGGSFKTSKRLIDQLQRYGLNVARELARGVMAIQDPLARLQEIKRILPYVLPELKPIDPVEDDLNNPEIPISTEDLLGALNPGGVDEPNKTKPNALSEVSGVPITVQAEPQGTSDSLQTQVGEDTQGTADSLHETMEQD